jgi:Na+/H+-dicarboxylate symporter
LKRSLTVLCILGLLLGLLLGVAAQRLDPAVSGQVELGAGVVIRAWTNAFRLIVPFLIVTQLYVALAARLPGAGGIVKLGLLIPTTFVGLMLLVTLFTTILTLVILALPLVQQLAASAPELSSTGGEVVRATAVAGPLAWVDELIPPNLLASASGDNILPLMLFAAAFSLAARSLASNLQRVLEQGATAVRDAMFVMVEWLVRLSPFMMVALGVRLASGSGLQIGGLMLAFGAIKVVLLLLGTVMLFALASVAGPFSPGRLARALFPAQLAALTTRSSLATVPALLKASDQDLKVPSGISSLVIPLAGSTLKVSRAVSDPLMLLFLAHVLGIQLSVGQMAVFFLTVLPMTIATPGVPRVVSGTRSVPAYVAVGIPPQYVVLFGTVTALTDAFLTLINTTGYMAANIVVTRFASATQPARSPAAPAVEHPTS